MAQWLAQSGLWLYVENTFPGKHKVADPLNDNQLDVAECHIYTSYQISFTLDQEE